MIKKGNICLNKYGRFLSVTKIMSHSPNDVYRAQWVGELNAATVFTTTNLSRYSWRGPSPVPDIIKCLPAESLSIVRLIED